MGQVNINPPPSGGVEPVGEPPGSYGAGMILGIIVAIILVALLVWFLVLGGGRAPTDGGGTTPLPAPSGWRLVDLA